jgi:hypothetical protein
MRGCSSLNSSDLWLITKLQNYKSLWGIMQVGMPAPNDGFPFNMIAHEPNPSPSLPLPQRNQTGAKSRRKLSFRSDAESVCQIRQAKECSSGNDNASTRAEVWPWHSPENQQLKS